MATSRKTELVARLTALRGMRESAEELWGAVSAAIASCKQGAAVSFEVLQQAVGAAEGCAVRDEDSAVQAQDFLSQAQAVAAECEQQLKEALLDAGEATVRAAKGLVERVHHYPVPAAVAQKVQQRHRVCSAVHDSERFLSLHDDIASSAEAVTRVLSDREMHSLRELSGTVEALAKAV